MDAGNVQSTTSVNTGGISEANDFQTTGQSWLEAIGEGLKQLAEQAYADLQNAIDEATNNGSDGDGENGAGDGTDGGDGNGNTENSTNDSNDDQSDEPGDGDGGGDGEDGGGPSDDINVQIAQAEFERIMQMITSTIESLKKMATQVLDNR